MRTRKLVVAGLLIFLIAVAQGEQDQCSVLLPESEANRLASMYPKKGPQGIDGSWQPSRSQIETLEASLPHISDLRNGGAPNGQKIEHPERYYRQYLAVVRAGQKVIHVNALCQVGEISYWRNQLAIVMDGGSCFWNAWYDPATEKFSELYINGRA